MTASSGIVVGDRVFADGVKRLFPQGPAECELVVDGGVLLVLPKSPLPPLSSETGGQRREGAPAVGPALASIALSAMFDRNDPLEFVALNRNSLVLHRRSDAGQDGLLLLFEREERLDEFLLALTPSSVAKAPPSVTKSESQTTTPSEKKPRIAETNTRASKSPVRVTNQQQTASSISTPTRRLHASPRPKKTLPSAAKTPTSAQHSNVVDQSAGSIWSHRTQSPSVSTSRAARRQGVATAAAADDATPSVSFVVASPSSDAHRGALYATPSSPVPPEQQHFGASGLSPAQSHYFDHHRQATTATTVPSPLPPPHQQQQQQSYSYPSHLSADSGGFGARGSVSGGSARSISASGVSKRSGSTAVDDYFRRTDRIESLIDTLEEASQERSSLLDDIFQQRDRRRLQTLLRLSLNDVISDDSKQQVGHKSSTAARSQHADASGRPLVQYHVDPQGGEGVVTGDGILDKIKSLLRSEAGSALRGHPVLPLEDTGSTTLAVSGGPTDDFVRQRGTFGDDGIGSVSLVARIKGLLSAGVGDFEALRDEAAEDGGEVDREDVLDARGARNTGGVRGAAPAPSQYSVPAGREAAATREAVMEPPVALSREMQLALEAEAKILNTIHYSALAVKKPHRIHPQSSDSESDTAVGSPLTKDPSRARLALHGAPASAAGGRPILDRDAVADVPADLAKSPAAPVPSSASASASPASPRPPMQQPVRAPSPEASPVSVTATSARPPAPAPSANNNIPPRATVTHQDTASAPLPQTPGSGGEGIRERAAVASSPASPWIEVKDSSTGRSYFVNRDTKATTWNRSETDLPQNHSTASAAPTASRSVLLPSSSPVAAGASETSPLAPSPATPSSPTPGPGWFAKIDPSTKRVFYVNPATKKTTWNLAETLAGATAATAEATTATASETKTATTTTPAPAPTPASPQGWVVKLDPKSGKAYYVNAALKKTTWKIEETDLSPQPQQGSSSIAATASNAVAASPWRAVIDPKSGKTYYVHKDTKQVSWKVPTTESGAM